MVSAASRRRLPGGRAIRAFDTDLPIRDWTPRSESWIARLLGEATMGALATLGFADAPHILSAGGGSVRAQVMSGLLAIWRPMGE
jgi:hypothetical protein